ncbi:MAG TPA: response regulator [Vicinamibacterales bacterium]|jgi:two-component system chemotaxis response regulator CheY
MPKAMVVDDSRTIRRILAGILGEIGFQVIHAENGKEALAIVGREREADVAISLALVDWNMPEMNGLEFVQQLRADVRNADMLVMMVTTETQVDQMVAALEAGANEYIMKPFTKDIIQGKLRLLGVVE